MKVAVMMPAYNAAPHIESALASLLQQRDDADLDIIVVDDGSTDGTGDVVRRLAAEAPQIRLIETPNGGVAKARNVALSAIMTDTDLVTSLDADDLSPRGRFARDVGLFERDPALEVIYGTMIAFRGQIADLAPRDDVSSVRIRGVQLGLMLMRADLMRRVGPFDTAFGQAEDIDYIMRTAELGPKMLLSDEISYYYRRHAGNISADGRESRRWLAFAALKSAKRRRADPSLAFPRGFFDPGNFAVEDKDWWFEDTVSLADLESKND